MVKLFIIYHRVEIYDGDQMQRNHRLKSWNCNILVRIFINNSMTTNYILRFTQVILLLEKVVFDSAFSGEI